MLAHAPRLHTLIISDAEVKEHGPRARFWFGRDVERQRALLGRYERHAPGQLRRVAFTSEFEWERDSGGRWVVTEYVDAEAAEESAYRNYKGIVGIEKLKY